MKPAKLDFGAGIVRHVRGVDLAQSVAASPFAIGIASYAETGNAQVLNLRGTCGFTLQAARRSIKTEDYPLTAPMFLYLPARRFTKGRLRILGVYPRSIRPDRYSPCRVC
jgi:phosphate transport system substrate-binding protein